MQHIHVTDLETQVVQLFLFFHLLLGLTVDLLSLRVAHMHAGYIRIGCSQTFFFVFRNGFLKRILVKVDGHKSKRRKVDGHETNLCVFNSIFPVDSYFFDSSIHFRKALIRMKHLHELI